MTSKISEVYDLNSQLFALQLGGAALTTTILQLNDYFTCNNFFESFFLFKGTSHRNTKWHVWNQSFFFAFWKFTRDGSSLRWHFWKSCTPTSVALLKTIRFFYRKVKGSNLEPGKKNFFLFFKLSSSIFPQNSKQLPLLEYFDVIKDMSSKEFLRFETDIPGQ